MNAARRLAEIAQLQRELAAEQTRLAEEAASLLTLEGPAPQAASDSVAGDILTTEHITVARLAEKLRSSEKTARQIGVAAGARVQIGGRVLFDLAAVRRHIASANYRVLPSSSLLGAEQIADDDVDTE